MTKQKKKQYEKVNFCDDDVPPYGTVGTEHMGNA